jgi:hypothetical protein
MYQLDLALEKMPVIFSSNEFSDKCKNLGIQDEFIKKGNLGKYLHRHCSQHNSKRMWSKQKTSKVINTNIEQAIALLKSEGYKISKQIVEWKEL